VSSSTTCQEKSSTTSDDRMECDKEKEEEEEEEGVCKAEDVQSKTNKDSTNKRSSHTGRGLVLPSLELTLRDVIVVCFSVSTFTFLIL
jgi:hypothetical protein